MRGGGLVLQVSTSFLPTLRDLVELLVTKNIFFPALRSLSRISGTPSITFKVENYQRQHRMPDPCKHRNAPDV